MSGRSDAALEALLSVGDAGSGDLATLLGVGDPVRQGSFDATGARWTNKDGVLDAPAADPWEGRGFVVEGFAYGEGGRAGLVILGKGGSLYSTQEFVGGTASTVDVHAIRNAPNGKVFAAPGVTVPSVPLVGTAYVFNTGGDFGITRTVTIVGTFSRAGRGSDGRWRVGEPLGTMDGPVVIYGSRHEDGKDSIINPEDLASLLGLSIPGPVFSRLPDFQII